MPAPNWAAGLGAALGGDSEAEYEKGRALGANTENALANARKTVDENVAKERARQVYKAAGLDDNTADMMSNAVLSGLKPEDPIQAMLKNQEFGFRAKAGDPNVPLDVGQRSLLGVANAPIEPLYKVGGGYGNKFDSAAGIAPLPHGAGGGEGGGQSSAMQYLSAAGALDANGQVRPGWERFAWRVQNPSQKTVMVGGVPTLVTDNPWEEAPSSPGSPPPRAFGAGSAPAPISAPPSPRVSAQPLATPAQVASNEGAVASAKEQGQMQGKAAAGLPDTLADIGRMRTNIQGLLAQPGFNKIYGNVQGNSVVSAVQSVADMSNETANAKAALSQLDAQAFGVSIQKMVGLGQLSNAEGLKVTAAFTRATNPTISEEEARAAWAEVLTTLDQSEQRAKVKAAAPIAPIGGAAPAAGGAVSLDEYLKSKGF